MPEMEAITSAVARSAHTSAKNANEQTEARSDTFAEGAARCAQRVPCRKVMTQVPKTMQ